MLPRTYVEINQAKLYATLMILEISLVENDKKIKVLGTIGLKFHYSTIKKARDTSNNVLYLRCFGIMWVHWTKMKGVWNIKESAWF